LDTGMPQEPEAYAAALAEAPSLTRIGEIVRSAARALTAADGATFVLRDGDLCFYADEDAIAPLWKGQRFPMTECISGWAMLNRDSVEVPDIEQDARIPLSAYRPTFVRSLIMTPIGREHPVGAIGAYWSRTGRPHPSRLAALQGLADATAAAIDRVGLDGAPWAPNFRVPGGSVRPGAPAV
jgi:GAF domain-containing protein